MGLKLSTAGVLGGGRDTGVLDTGKRPREEAEDHRLPAMDRGRGRTKPFDPLTLGFQPQNCDSIHFGLSRPACGVLLWQP